MLEIERYRLSVEVGIELPSNSTSSKVPENELTIRRLSPTLCPLVTIPGGIACVIDPLELRDDPPPTGKPEDPLNDPYELLDGA